ncbi:Quinone oxidoreductase [Hypsibius exemplaris]|uniref:Quinone oxidoreductase n=1 Tax=Hypsibius exemplaris TaxID=2072580 RepID=A0A1W0XF96_HYPEX|nr:Quinone oxidoreductase [Hypsibius exemplaris]
MADNSRQMKAVRFEKTGPSSVLTVVDVPINNPGPDQVLVRVHAAGLNPVEVLIRSGFFPVPPSVQIIGTDAAGVVAEVGSNVKDYKKGDRVVIYAKSPAYQSGTYAQYFLADPDMLFHLPEKYSFEDGASLGIPFLTAYYNIVLLARAKAGEVVLVNGASGATGLYAIEVARAMGCKVIGTAGHENGLALIAEKGATAVSYKASDLMEQIKAAAGPNGVDIVLETKPSNLANDLELLAPLGRVLLISASGKVDQVNLGPVLFKQLNIRGSSCFGATAAHYKLMRVGLEDALKAGAIKPVIQKVYKLDEIVQAHDDLEHNPVGVAGKLVLDLS